MAEAVFSAFLAARQSHHSQGLRLRELHREQRLVLKQRLTSERTHLVSGNGSGVDRAALLVAGIADDLRLRRELARLQREELSSHLGQRPRFRDVLDRLRAGARDDLLLDVIRSTKAGSTEFDALLGRFANGVFVPRRDGSDVSFRRDGIEAYRVSRSRGEVYVAQVDPETVAAALVAAAQLHPKGVTLSGSKEFLELAVNQSVAISVKILNPELQPRIRELLATASAAQTVAGAVDRIAGDDVDVEGHQTVHRGRAAEAAQPALDEADVIDLQATEADREDAAQPVVAMPAPTVANSEPGAKPVDSAGLEEFTPSQLVAVRALFVGIEQQRLIKNERLQDHASNLTQVLDGTLVRSYPLGAHKTMLVVRDSGTNHLVDVDMSMQDVRAIARRNVIMRPDHGNVSIALGNNIARDMVLKQHLGTISADAAERRLPVRAAAPTMPDGYAGRLTHRFDLGFNQTLAAVQTDTQVVHVMLPTAALVNLSKGDPVRLEFHNAKWEPLYAKEVELAADREDLGPPLDPEER